MNTFAGDSPWKMRQNIQNDGGDTVNAPTFCAVGYRPTAYSFLIVCRVAGQIVLLADLAGLFVLDSLQLGAGGDAMAKTAAVGAAPVPDGLVHLVELRLDGGEEGGHLLLGLNEQMLEIRQHSLVHLHQQ